VKGEVPGLAERQGPATRPIAFAIHQAPGTISLRTRIQGVTKFGHELQSPPVSGALTLGGSLLAKHIAFQAPT